jgi:hypothetical protein
MLYYEHKTILEYSGVVLFIWLVERGDGDDAYVRSKTRKAALPNASLSVNQFFTTGGSMHPYIVILMCLVIPIPIMIAVVRKDNQEKYGVGFIPLFRSKKNGTMPEMSKSAHKMLA